MTYTGESPNLLDPASVSVIGVAHEAMSLLREKRSSEAFSLLRPFAAVELRASDVRPMGRLALALKAALKTQPELRIAFAGHVTLDDVAATLGWYLVLRGLRLESLILPFGAWEQQLRDPDSELCRFRPNILWIFVNDEDLRNAHPSYDSSPAVDDVATRLLERTVLACRLAEAAVEGVTVVVNNAVPSPWRVFGNIEETVVGAPAESARRFNLELRTALPASVGVFDIAYVANSFGLRAWHDERLSVHSKHPFSLEAHGCVASAMAGYVMALKGRSKKCIVVDLDNTLWGGVVGDDGPDGIAIGADGGAIGESFERFQRWLKALGQRGIVLAVCSKNDLAVATRAFESHPGMPLSLTDFAAFRANWGNKADNIRDIALELNLGLDAFVFVDDNPAERALVRRELPEVFVPDLPSDPTGYIGAIAHGCWFETLTISDEDRKRTQSYVENANRHRAESAASDLPTFLTGLEMVATWGCVGSDTLARAVQLINKTNQFHVTTTRYSEAQLGSMCNSPSHWVGRFSLKDRYGDHGITSVVVMEFRGKSAFVDTWVMSCRVFARSYEQYIFNLLVKVARERGANDLHGTFIPSAKNSVVSKLFESFGGTLLPPSDSAAMQWVFDISSGYSPQPTYIR